MDPAAIAALLQNGGPYGAMAILCGVIVKLWTDLREESRGRLDDTKQANATVYSALKTIDTIMSTLNIGGK